MNTQQMIEFVRLLNQRYLSYVDDPRGLIPFKYASDGELESITFMDISVWDENHGTFDVEGCVFREVELILGILSKIKIEELKAGRLPSELDAEMWIRQS